MRELLFVDFANYDQSCKNQSWKNVGSLTTIIKNKYRRKLRYKYSIDLRFPHKFIETAS